MRELHFQRGLQKFQRTPSHEGRAHQMLMRVNIRCHICLQRATVVNYFAQMLSFGRIQRSFIVPPTVLVHLGYTDL